MPKLLVITFLCSFLLISFALNVLLFMVNESNKTRKYRIEDQLDQVTAQYEVLQQRHFLCEALLQECMSTPEEATHLFISSEEDDNIALTRF